MVIAVDIADRLYDYTDEEAAADAIAEFQSETGLTDLEILALWADDADLRRSKLEKIIFDAVDLNGSSKRAESSVPVGITLQVG